jgi:hypothetical protein
MASTVHQEYELPDGASLTITWAAERPATEDELALLGRIARMVAGRDATRAPVHRRRGGDSSTRP